MSSRPRLWPVFLITSLGAFAILGVWVLGDTIRQYRVLRTLGATIVTLLLLLLWLVFFSRLPARARLLAVGALAMALGLGATFFRVRGVSGDLLPIVDLRWARPEPPPLHPPPPLPTPVPAETAVGPEPPKATDKAVARSPERTAATARPAAATSPPGPAEPAAPEWPQFLGPSRTATLPGPQLARDWTSRPPRLVWRQVVGPAWSSFAVGGGVAVTQEQRAGDELVVAYDFVTGRPLWSHADKARYETVVAGVGPRATPTIADGRVFAQGATGILNALDLQTGRLLWSHATLEENGATEPAWGKSGSPLVVGGRVVVSVGGTEGRSLVAYDAVNGERAWAGGHDGASYSSPTLVSLAGRPQIVIFNQGSVAGHDPDTGALLWEHVWPAEQPNVAQPLLLGADRLLFSAGYGIGSKVFAISSDESRDLHARLQWESPRLKSKFANLVLHDGFVYGLDDGVLTCLDPATGERKFKGGRYGHGQILLVGGLLLVQTEDGEAVLLETSPTGARELARFPLLEGKMWNPPALVGSRLLVRNDREAALYELPVID